MLKDYQTVVWLKVPGDFDTEESIFDDEIEENMKKKNIIMRDSLRYRNIKKNKDGSKVIELNIFVDVKNAEFFKKFRIEDAICDVIYEKGFEVLYIDTEEDVLEKNEGAIIA